MLSAGAATALRAPGDRGYMVNIQNFGIVLGIGTLVAFLADVLLALALMALTAERLLRPAAPMRAVPDPA